MSESRTVGTVSLLGLVIGLPLAAAIGGCSMFALKRDLARMEEAASISGTIERESPSSNPIVVGLLEQQVSRDAVLDYVVMPAPGKFRFFANPGAYFVVGGTPQADIEAEEAGGAPVPSHHSPLFKIEPEPAVTAGVQAMTVAVLELLGKP